MFCGDLFPYVEEALDKLTCYGPNAKNGIRLLFGYTLKTEGNALQGMYLIDPDNEKPKVLKNFL